MEDFQNMTINGMGDVHGGSYNRVTISGMGRVIGDIEASMIMLNGTGKLEGNVNTRELMVNGKGKIGGTLVARELENNGHLTLEGHAEVGDMRNRGRIHALAGMRGRDVSSYGNLTIDGDVHARAFKSRGMFEIGGNLSAQEVDLEVTGVSRLQEIDGEHVRVAKLSSGFSSVMKMLSAFFPKLEDNRLEAQTIKGATLMLDCVQADLVVGRHVKIGPNCRINRVVYSDQLVIDPNAVVLEQVKVEPQPKTDEPILLP